MSKILLGAIALTIIVYLSSLNWKRSVKAALIVLVLEGALRKWALPQASQLIYFLKDFILIGAYLKFFFFTRENHPRVVRNNVVVTLVAMAFIWGVVQAFNPSLGSPIIGLFGLKNYFLYIPLLWLVPLLFDSEEELFYFLRTYLLLLIPVGLLAIAQFFSPPSSPLNVYAWQDGDMAIAVGGDGQSVRVTGTFSYLAGYTIFLCACLCLLLPFLSVRQSRLWQYITLVEFLLIAITAFMTASRGMMITAILLIVGYISLQGVKSLSEVVRTARQFILPSLIAATVITWRFRTAVDSLWLRVTKNSDVSNRVSRSFLEPFRNFQYKQIDGYGIGATFQANRFLRGFFGLPPGEAIPVYYEGEMGRIALDIGPLGFFLWYGLKLVLLVALWHTYQRLQRPFLKRLALSAFLLQAIMFNGQLVYNHTANLYHWFLFSFTFLLPRLEQIAQAQEYQEYYYHSELYGYPKAFPDSSHQ